MPDKVIIYDLEKGDEADMNYRVKDRIQQRIDCNLLVITAEHLVLCYVRTCWKQSLILELVSRACTQVDNQITKCSCTELCVKCVFTGESHTEFAVQRCKGT